MAYRLLAGLILCCSAQAASLPWDLSYQSALRTHPAAAQEGWADWVASYPRRPIHQLLAEYAGPPIESAILIEQPGPHASHTLATWIYTTREGAQWCGFDERSLPLKQQICSPMERAVAQEIIRAAMRMPDPSPPARTAGARDDKTFYFGYLSVYVDGQVVQRPIGGDEWQTPLDTSRPPGPEAGRLFKVISPVVLAAGPVPADDSTELQARTELINQVQGYLRAADYKQLEALRARLLASRERTGSGVWKLAIFYNQLRDFPGRSRDPLHWGKMFDLRWNWEKKYPNSIAAKVFAVDVAMAEGLSYRGTGWFKDVPKEDFAKLRAHVAQAKQGLYYLEKPMLKDKDPEYFRLAMSVGPWDGYFIPTAVREWLDEGSKLYPGYHETYFTAALYSTDMWTAAPDEVDNIARLRAGKNDPDAAAIYARVYWYANVELYGDRLFDDNKTLVDWDTMKTSFDALVAGYSDPWNLNAYAYYACRARDYPVMTSLLERIGQRRVPASWGRGGAAAYEECANHKGEPRRWPSREEISQRKIAHYQRYLNYAIRLRDEKRYDESLRAMDKVSQLAALAYSRPGMQEYYHRALTLHALKRYEDEIQALTTGLQYQQGYAEALYQRGLAYEALNRKDEARQNFEEAALRLPDLKLSTEPEQRKRGEESKRTMTAKLAEYGISVPSR